jgi:hypothetical protein
MEASAMNVEEKETKKYWSSVIAKISNSSERMHAYGLLKVQRKCIPQLQRDIIPSSLDWDKYFGNKGASGDDTCT